MFLCPYIYKGSQYISMILKWCMWYYLQRRIVFTLFTNHSTKQHFVATDGVLSHWFSPFSLQSYASCCSPVEESQHTCSVLTTYLKDNTALFMHTYTVNKILDIKLSLWQMLLKVHSQNIFQNANWISISFQSLWRVERRRVLNICW